VRAPEKSAEAVVVKIAVETRWERRAEGAGKRDQPNDSGRRGAKFPETGGTWQLRPLSRLVDEAYRGGRPGVTRSRGASHEPGEERE
jgi:hypothetical protein